MVNVLAASSTWLTNPVVCRSRPIVFSPAEPDTPRCPFQFHGPPPTARQLTTRGYTPPAPLRMTEIAAG